MTARATKDLSQFSLDFEGLAVTGVRVAGQPATFNRVAPAACSPSPPATSCAATKLIVNPAEPIADNRLFTVRVSYPARRRSTPTPTARSRAGSAPARRRRPASCDGAFVVNQPIGAMTWFPSNNYPTDKALFDTAITVPSTHKAIRRRRARPPPVDNGNGTTTWNWTEDDPTATYLTTATVGLFDLTRTR